MSFFRPRALVGMLTLALPLTSSAAHAQQHFTGSTSAFFSYVPSPSEPHDPGTLIRYQKFKNAWGVVPDPNLYRVLYWSTVEMVVDPEDADPSLCQEYTFAVDPPVTRCCSDADGDAGVPLDSAVPCNDENGDPDIGYTVTETRCRIPVATSGLVRIPSDSNGPIAGLPSLAFTHGTLGSLPKCGPSRDLGAWWPQWMEHALVKTVAADYAGLGYDSGLRSVDATVRNPHPWYGGLVYMYPFDESTHPYGDLLSTGTATVDVVRAGNQLEEVLTGNTSPNPAFAVIGSSQGGAAAMATGYMSSATAGYAQELDLRFLVAGAPGSRLHDPGTLDIKLAQGLLAAGVVGASMTDPSISPDELMTPIGQANYQRTTEQVCSGTESLESYAWWINTLYSYPFHDSACVLMRRPEWRRFAARQRISTLPIDAPVLLAQVHNDTLVPPDRTDDVFEELRTHADVTYCTYEGDSGGLLGGHTQTLEKSCEGTALTCVRPDGSPADDTLYDPASAVELVAHLLLDVSSAQRSAYIASQKPECGL